MDISTIQEYVNNHNILLSGHVTERMEQRGILLIDIFNAISSGEIIEDYPNNSPYPSCLILGYTKNKPIHICI